MSSLLSLRALAVRAYKKSGRPVPDGFIPPPLKNLVDDFFFFFPNTDQPRCQKIVALAKKVQNVVGLPCVIGGGFATFMCQNTNTFNDLDMYTVIEHEDQINDIEDNLNTALQEEIWDVSKFSTYSTQSVPRLIVLKLETSRAEALRIDLVFFIESNPQKLALLHTNWIALGERVTQSFDLEITKCLGFPMRDGGFMFTSFSTNENQIFTLSDLRLTTALSDFSAISNAPFRRFISSLSKSHDSPMLQTFLAREDTSSPYADKHFQTFWTRVRKYMRRAIRYPRPINVDSLRTLLMT